jgi:PAS domain S-box-containing protein
VHQTLEEDPALAGAAAPSPRKVHPIATLHYPVRVASHLLVLIVMASVLVHAQPPPWAWAWLGVTGLLWGHVAFVIASRSKDTRAAELRNLLADNLLVGGFAALSGFSLWPSVMMFTAVAAGSLGVGGPTFALRGAAAFAVGSLLMLSLTGLTFTPEASLFTSTLSAAGIFVFCAMHAFCSNLEAKRALRAGREVHTRNLRIEEQRRLVQQSRDLAEAERAAADQARERAQAASRAKGAFLAHISHELRTPVDAIIGRAEMLEADIDEPARRSHVQQIRTSGKHLLGLIDDVLDLSRIEAGKVELRVDVLDVDELVDEVASIARPLLAGNANRFELRRQQPLGVMTSDATRLRQVLLNLLSNAAKFTHGGEVILAVRREHGERGGWLEFEVMDSGIGMTLEQVSKLFQPFVQVDASRTRTYGGTGLGLAISRRLCRLMGGDITVDSEEGHGTRFVARVPARAPEPKTQAEGAADTPPRPQARNAALASRLPATPLADEAWMPQSQRIISQGVTSPAVFRISPEGTFLNMNAAMARMLGYGSPAQMLGSVSDFGTQVFAAPQAWPDYRRRLLAAGFVNHFEFEARRADGSSMWLSQDACVVRDEKGSVARFECFATDITELKRECLALGERLSQALGARPPPAGEPPRGIALDLALPPNPRRPGTPSSVDLHAVS